MIANRALTVEVLARREAEEELRKLNETLERRINESTASLEELHRRKDEFLAMLSHELRNPLAPIANAVKLLHFHEGADLVQRRALAIIERQVVQLTRLIDDLLDVSRITAGRIQLRKERLVLNGVVNNAVETVRPLLDQRRHELTVALPPQQVHLFADAVRVEQVLVNLLTNAAKYTEEGGKIWLTVQQEGDACVLRVRDTGIGIAPEFLPHVFDLFTQAARSLDRSQGGLGIGLALVNGLVEMHQGRVEVQSTPGKGSEFTVHFPMMKDAPLQPGSTKEETVESAGSCLRVMIVDDNEDATVMLGMLLEALGHRIQTAFDGPAALDTALEFRPHVALMDLGLPGMDGYEVARRLREQAIFKDVVLVAMTGYGRESDRQLSREAGFDHHLVKPADFDKLQKILIACAADLTSPNKVRS